MILTNEDVYLEVAGTKKMRVLVNAPKDACAEIPYCGVLMYSDIFQITGAQLRVSRRLAGYGFVVATPEIWHRTEPSGAAIPFDDDGRTRGLANASATAVADMDSDAHAVLDWLSKDPRVKRDDGGPGARLAAVGFCIGGHLAFRAALDSRVRASACFYPTGVHNGKLGQDADAGTIARARAGEIKGELMLVYGARDPHVPEAARHDIEAALTDGKTTSVTKLYDAEHAFMRDEGPRYDPEATDDAWLELVRFLRRTL